MNAIAEPDKILAASDIQPVIQNPDTDICLDTRIDEFYYGKKKALHHVHFKLPKNQITAFIGPSGCGKSTTLRCYNRMNDEKTCRLVGGIDLEGHDIYGPKVSKRLLRTYIGMVFQQPNPFHVSIFDNVAFGLRLAKFKGDLHERVEQSLRRAVLWDEVKDHLHDSGLDLSGGQQQRLCIARAIAMEPEVLLMDEPCSALDPISTVKIEELMLTLKEYYTIVIVTHNMGQAKRVGDYIAYFFVERREEKGGPYGQLIEYGTGQQVMEEPKHELTKDYLGGKMG